MSVKLNKIKARRRYIAGLGVAIYMAGINISCGNKTSDFLAGEQDNVLETEVPSYKLDYDYRYESLERSKARGQLFEKTDLKDAIDAYVQAFPQGIKREIKIKFEKREKAFKDCVKLGIYPDALQSLFVEPDFRDAESLKSKVLLTGEFEALKSNYGDDPHNRIGTEFMQFHIPDVDDYNPDERLGLEFANIINSIHALSIMLENINSKPEVQFSKIHKESIEKCLKEQMNFLSGCGDGRGFEDKFISSPENLNATAQYLDSEGAIMGEGVKKKLKNGTTVCYESALTTWSRSKELKEGRWDSIVGISWEKDKIENLLTEFTKTHDTLRRLLKSPNAKDREMFEKDYEKNLETLGKLRKIISTKERSSVETELLDTEGLKWVGKWRQEGTDEQLDVNTAIEFSKILDWSSAAMIELKYGKVLEVPIFGSNTIFGMRNPQDFWCKESEIDKRGRVLRQADRRLGMTVALSPIWVPLLAAIAVPAFLIAAPIYGVYQLAKS